MSQIDLGEAKRSARPDFQEGTFAAWDIVFPGGKYGYVVEFGGKNVLLVRDGRVVAPSEALKLDYSGKIEVVVEVEEQVEVEAKPEEGAEVEAEPEKKMESIAVRETLSISFPAPEDENEVLVRLEYHGELDYPGDRQQYDIVRELTLARGLPDRDRVGCHDAEKHLRSPKIDREQRMHDRRELVSSLAGWAVLCLGLSLIGSCTYYMVHETPRDSGKIRPLNGNSSRKR